MTINKYKLRAIGYKLIEVLLYLIIVILICLISKVST